MSLCCCVIEASLEIKRKLKCTWTPNFFFTWLNLFFLYLKHLSKTFFGFSWILRHFPFRKKNLEISVWFSVNFSTGKVVTFCFKFLKFLPCCFPLLFGCCRSCLLHEALRWSFPYYKQGSQRHSVKDTAKVHCGTSRFSGHSLFSYCDFQSLYTLYFIPEINILVVWLYIPYLLHQVLMLAPQGQVK